MNDDPINPYAAPQTPLASDPFSESRSGMRPAGRFNRLAASIADTIVIMAIYLPIQYSTDYVGKIQQGEAGLLFQFAMMIAGLLAFLLPNGYLLATRGQSIGKFLAKIRIVDANTRQLLPFSRVYVYRVLWLYPVVIITTLISGIFDHMLVNVLGSMLLGVLGTVDVLFIFRADRRCIHDLIAGSIVVDNK